MHLEAVIVPNCRPSSSEFGDALVGHDRVRLDEYLGAVDGQRARWCESSHQFVYSQLWECHNVTLRLCSCRELADRGQSWREVRQKLKLHSRVNS